MELPASISYLVGLTYQYKFKNFISTPKLDGTYIFDITTYLADGTTLLESYSEYL